MFTLNGNGFETPVTFEKASAALATAEYVSEACPDEVVYLTDSAKGVVYSFIDGLIVDVLNAR